MLARCNVNVYFTHFAPRNDAVDAKIPGNNCTGDENYKITLYLAGILVKCCSKWKCTSSVGVIYTAIFEMQSYTYPVNYFERKNSPVDTCQEVTIFGL